MGCYPGLYNHLLGNSARMSDSSSIGSAWIPIAISLLLFVVFVGFIIWGIVKFVGERRAARELAARPPGHFVFARIMDSILPMGRGPKYEEPLNEALRARGLGLVTGGGTQMSRDGSSIEWVGIDLELSDLGDALAFTRNLLRELGAPAGSVLEYRVGEQKMTVQIT